MMIFYNLFTFIFFKILEWFHGLPPYPQWWASTCENYYYIHSFSLVILHLYIGFIFTVLISVFIFKCFDIFLQPFQKILGPVPEGFDQYFSTRFPVLLIEVYKVVCVYCKEEDSFRKYFDTSLIWWTFMSSIPMSHWHSNSEDWSD